MNNDERYRKSAAEAQAWADKARTEQDRAAWLRVAQGWLSLIRKRPNTAQEDFEEAAQQRGTHQDISDRSQ